MGRKIAAIFLLATLLASACASAPQPSNAEIADACLLLQQNKPWRDTLREVARQWGAPMGYTLAVVKQESSFDSQALAPRGERQWFGLLEGSRVSSAAGYSQALDGTWEMYRKATGKWGANRNDFRDASDFIGWYYNTNGQRVGIAQYDYRAHYLVYHEGATGYLKGSWRSKGWLVGIADKVASQAARYEYQISNCPGLKPQKFLGLF